MSNPAIEDSLKPKRRGSTGSVTVDLSQSVINSLFRTGKIDLIENDSLKYMLTSWNDLLADYKEDEQWHINFVHTRMYPYETNNLPGHFFKYHPKNGVVSPFKTPSEVSAIYERVFKDAIYRNIILRNHQLLDGTIKEGNRVIKAMQDIIYLLNNEIKSKER